MSSVQNKKRFLPAIERAHDVRRPEIAGIDSPHACGLIVGGNTWNVRLRVTSGNRSVEYVMDRWD